VRMQFVAIHMDDRARSAAAMRPALVGPARAGGLVSACDQVVGIATRVPMNPVARPSAVTPEVIAARKLLETAKVSPARFADLDSPVSARQGDLFAVSSNGIVGSLLQVSKVRVGESGW